MVACISDQPLYAIANGLRPDHVDIVFFPPNQPARLRVLSRTFHPLLLLRIELSCTLKAGSRNIYASEVVAYTYRIQATADAELPAYHWHPYGISDQRDPHLHLSHHIDPTSSGVPPLSGMHLPTGPIELSSIVRLLIEEFKIEPRREDWRDVLSRSVVSD